jgi:hypothetical protein
LISKHKAHSEQSWALPSEDLQKVEEVFNLYKPTDEKREKLYLFGEGHISLPEGLKRREMSYEESQRFVNAQCLSSLQSIYKKEGLNGILWMAKELKSTYHLARTVADLNLIEEEEIILLTLIEKDKLIGLCSFSQEYILAKSSLNTHTWVLWAWQKVKSLCTDIETLARFFLALPQGTPTWNLLETTSPEVIKLYWKNVNPDMYSTKMEENLYVLKALQNVNRHLTVLDKVTHIPEHLTSSFLAEVLTKAATIPSEENRQFDSYGIGKVFEVLDSRNDLAEQKLAQLEVLYLSFLTALDSERRPKQLFKELASNAGFFVDVVSIIYFPDDYENEKGYSEEELSARYKKLDNARRLLESWREIPGVEQDGRIDKEKLTNWVCAVRTKAHECKLTYGVDSEVGKLLACYPRNSEMWPPDEICEVIDTLDSDTITSHFETEIFNSRGVSVRSPYEGGAQERRLSAYFEKMAKQIAVKWPVTSAALRNLAKSYANDAKREDERAQLDELR